MATPTLTAQQASALNAFLQKQKSGAQCVLSAPLLGMEIRQFDALAKHWIQYGATQFILVGVPFRKVIDGEFLIQRLTVIKRAEGEDQQTAGKVAP